MKVFLAGIMQGSIAEAKIHPQDWREPIQRAFARHAPGAEVYCHYTRHRGSMAYEMPDVRRTLEDGIERAARCDVLVAYLPGASMGTAIEMYRAHQCGAVVLTISPMAANWVIRCYSDRVFADMDAFERFLADGELAKLVVQKRG